jgi:hypothetical protein
MLVGIWIFGNFAERRFYPEGHVADVLEGSADGDPCSDGWKGVLSDTTPGGAHEITTLSDNRRGGRSVRTPQGVKEMIGLSEPSFINRP